MGLGFLQINTKIMVFWGIIEHIFVQRELHFGKTSWHQLQDRKLFYHEGGGSIFSEMLIISCHMTWHHNPENQNFTGGRFSK
jgi:hypothetical protein